MRMDIFLVLIIMNAGISLIMGFYMVFLRRNSSVKGPEYWAAGALVIGVGLLLKVIFPIGSVLEISGLPIFLTIGLYLYLAGILKFKGKRINKWIVIGIPILDILQFIILFKVFHSFRVQIALHQLVIVAYCLFSIIEMLRLSSTQKYLRKIFFINALSYIIFLIFVLLNFYALITNQNTDPLEISITVIFIHIISGFVMIALTFGFLTAVNVQLNMELEDQLKSKTKFLSIIGHDLRGPVGNIMNFLDLLQNKSDLNEKKRKEYLTILTTLSQSTFHLLQNLLEWATKSKYLNKFESERIELSQIISNDLNFFKSSTAVKSIKLEIIEGERTYFLGSVNMIQTIVRNLVSNAIKYTSEGGIIAITSEKVLDKVRLVVSDTGQGMNPETINSLFKFETTESRIGTRGEVGSGLGLALCIELASINNGVIEIESQEGIGTIVVVEFPAVD